MRETRIRSSHRRPEPPAASVADTGIRSASSPSPSKEPKKPPSDIPTELPAWTTDRPTDDEIRGAATQAVDRFDWRALPAFLERPYDAVVRFCRAVMHCPGGSSKWAVQAFVRERMVQAFDQGEAMGRSLMEFAFLTIWRIADVVQEMCAKGRHVRRDLPEGQAVIHASVPDYPGVRLFIVLRTVDDGDASVCAIRTPGEFNRDTRHGGGRHLAPYHRPSPGTFHFRVA